jgi:hypothetical protein
MLVSSRSPLAQVVLQTQKFGEQICCQHFDQVPSVNPSSITIVSDGSLDGRAGALIVAKSIAHELVDAGAITSASVCCGSSADVDRCTAWGEPRRRKLVVLIADGITPIDNARPAIDLDLRDETCSVIPVFPLRARTQVNKVLPEGLRLWNAEFWVEEVGEVVPAILARAGLAIDRPRIFISYRQIDTAALASQIFDALSHKNCDVFLDHFRIEAGVDFQARLTEELGDKSMFVLLESAAILNSLWVKFEIAKATALGIGRLALAVPGAKASNQINDATRTHLSADDFEAGRYSPEGVLTSQALHRVTRRILAEHVRALFRRRASLQNSMQTALQSYGVTRTEFDHFGALHVYRSSVATREDYIVWLSTSPPGLSEFYTAHSDGRPPAKGVVIGPAQTIAALRHRQTTWLAARSKLVFVDEGLLRPAALRMAQGTL